MTNILTKIIKANQEYEILGGGSSSTGEGHEVVTQAAYDLLTPAQKAEKVYMITDEGVTPTPMPGSVDSFNRFITNTPLLEISGSGGHNNITMPAGASFVCIKERIGNGYTTGNIVPLSFVMDIAQYPAYDTFYLLEADNTNRIKYNGDGTYNVNINGSNNVVCVF